MTEEYKTGYKKPPLHSRFKKGVCPNPKGRGKPKFLQAGKIFRDVMNSPVVPSNRGKKKPLPRIEVTLRGHAIAGVKGDVGRADSLIKFYAHALSQRADESEVIILTEKEAANRIARGLMPAGAGQKKPDLFLKKGCKRRR